MGKQNSGRFAKRTSNVREARTRVTQNEPQHYDITMKKKGAVILEDKVLLHGQMFDLPESKDKLPYNNIVEDFKKRHPNLGKNIAKWQAWGYATVRIWIGDGMILDYNYDEHMAKIVKG